MLPNQSAPFVVCNFAEPQRIPTYNTLSVRDLTELNRGQIALQEELKALKELCLNISQSVNELSAKLSQYDIDSGSEVTDNNPEEAGDADDAGDADEVGGTDDAEEPDQLNSSGV